MSTSQKEKTVLVIGPQYKDAEGYVKVGYVPREIPERLWNNADHRRDLIQAGVTLYQDVAEPAVAERRGRRSNAEKELEAAQAKIAALKAELAEKETKPEPDAGKA